MASRLQRRLENQQAQGIDMSPLLDVVFILLIFFIVSTVFVKDKLFPNISVSSAKKQKIKRAKK